MIKKCEKIFKTVTTIVSEFIWYSASQKFLNPWMNFKNASKLNTIELENM